MSVRGNTSGEYFGEWFGPVEVVPGGMSASIGGSGGITANLVGVREAAVNVPSGVQAGKPIRLREVEKREDLAEYLKAQLNLRHGDLVPKIQKPTKAQKAEQKKIEVAMKSMAQELEQERLVQANNDLLTLMLLAEV